MTTAIRGALAGLVASALFAGAADARDYLRADLKISAVWARASVAKAAEAYMTLLNTGTEPERLLAMSSPVAKRVELQRYEGTGGYKGPQTMESLAIPAGETATLKPGAAVIALVGLKRALSEGGKVMVTLTFERAGAVSVSIPIVGAGADGPPEAPKTDEKAKK